VRAFTEITKDPSTWPEAIDKLPFDDKRKLPIPFIAQREDGSFDFTTINSDNAVACLNYRLCAVCGLEREWWSVFIGGPLSHESHNYQTPPMHEECAEFALALCPFIAIAGAKRATDNHASGVLGPAQSAEKPESWHWGKCRTNTIKARLVPLDPKKPSAGQAILFQAGRWVDSRTFIYKGKKLVEV
jgi:ferredoxin